MDTTLQSLFTLMRVTLTDPAEGARRVVALDLPRAALWQAFALVVVMSVLLVELSGALLPQDPESPMAVIYANPFLAMAIQGAGLFITVHAVHRIGAAFGGTGSLEDSLKVMVWLQIMLIALQLVQILTALILLPLLPLVFIATIAWSLWTLTTFVMVVHGFSNGGKVFLGIILSSIAIAFALLILLTMLSALGIVNLPEPA